MHFVYRFDLELHLVHESPSGEVAVIGIMYKLGRPDSFLSMVHASLCYNIISNCIKIEIRARRPLVARWYFLFLPFSTDYGSLTRYGWGWGNREGNRCYRSEWHKIREQEVLQIHGVAYNPSVHWERPMDYRTKGTSSISFTFKLENGSFRAALYSRIHHLKMFFWHLTECKCDIRWGRLQGNKWDSFGNPLKMWAIFNSLLIRFDSHFVQYFPFPTPNALRIELLHVFIYAGCRIQRTSTSAHKQAQHPTLQAGRNWLQGRSDVITHHRLHPSTDVEFPHSIYKSPGVRALVYQVEAICAGYVWSVYQRHLAPHSSLSYTSYIVVRLHTSLSISRVIWYEFLPVRVKNCAGTL